MLNTPGGVELPLLPLLMLERPMRMPLRYTCIVCCGRLTSTTTDPYGESRGFHQYSPGLSGSVGLPVGVPLVWTDGGPIAKEVATGAGRMAMTHPNLKGRSQQLAVTLASKKKKPRARRMRHSVDIAGVRFHGATLTD